MTEKEKEVEQEKDRLNPNPENGKLENGQESRRLSDVTDESYDDDDIADFIPTPPDGGWGWVIVAASLMCNIIVDGIGYSFGIFLPEFVRTFGESRSKVSLIGSLLCGTYLCAGPIVSGLTNKFGCRPVAMTGSVIATIAFVLATFSPNIEILILTYGVMGGFGFGMIYLPSIVSVGYYFEKKRAVATGIAVCGSGIGTFIFAPLTKALLDGYNWKNALFILAGIVFNGCVCGALMRPLEPVRKPKKIEKPREKNVLDRIKEAQKKRRRNNFSECSAIGPTDTTDILEKVRQAKMKREMVLQDTESEICSLPSTYFEKDRPVQRQDSLASTAIRSRIQKLSFSERGDNLSTKTETPVTTPRIMLGEPNLLGSGYIRRDSEYVDGNSEHDSSQASSPVRSKSPDGERLDSPTKKRMSSVSTGDHHYHHGKPEKITLPNGVQGYEVQPLITVGNGGVKNPKKNAAKELMARSGAAPAGGSRAFLGASTRSITSRDYARPMYKKDIFYSGSVLNITEFKSQPNMSSYITSITSIPGDCAVVDAPPETALHRVCSCLPKPVVDVLSEMLDVSLFKNKGFMCICLGNVFAMIGFYVPYVYIVDRALLLGIDATQASFLLSVIGITNTFGRVVSGLVADLQSVNSLMLNNVCMLIAGICIVLTPLGTSYASLVVAASVFGLTTAAYISLTSIIICDLLGLEKLTNAFGLMTLARGVSSVLGPPLAGAMFARTGSYDASFFLGGGLFLIGTALHFALFLPCFKNKEEEYIVEVQEREMNIIPQRTISEKPEPVQI